MKLLEKLLSKIKRIELDYTPLFRDYEEEILGIPVYHKDDDDPTFDIQVNFLFSKLDKWEDNLKNSEFNEFFNNFILKLYLSSDKFYGAADLQEKFKRTLECLVLLLCYKAGKADIPLEKKCDALKRISLSQLEVCAEGIYTHLQDVLLFLESDDEIIIAKNSILTQLIKEFAKGHKNTFIDDERARRYKKNDQLSGEELDAVKNELFKRHEIHIVNAIKNYIARSDDDYGLEEEADYFARGYDNKLKGRLFQDLKGKIDAELGPCLIDYLATDRRNYIAANAILGTENGKTVPYMELIKIMDDWFGNGDTEKLQITNLIFCHEVKKGNFYRDNVTSERIIRFFTIQKLKKDGYIPLDALQQFELSLLIDGKNEPVQIFFFKETQFFIAFHHENCLELEAIEFFNLVKMDDLILMKPHPDNNAESFYEFVKIVLENTGFSKFFHNVHDVLELISHFPESKIPEFIAANHKEIKQLNDLTWKNITKLIAYIPKEERWHVIQSLLNDLSAIPTLQNRHARSRFFSSVTNETNTSPLRAENRSFSSINNDIFNRK